MILLFEHDDSCLCCLNRLLQFIDSLLLASQLILELGFLSSAHLQIGFEACVLSLMFLDFSIESLDSRGLLGLLHNPPNQLSIGL